MGKLQIFEVVYDGGDMFRPGDTLEGHLKLVLNEVKKDIRGVTIKFEGRAKTQWYVYNAGSKTNDKYYAKEIYFKENKLILGKDKEDTSGEKVHLDAGEHKFPFKFEIPNKTLPHAFEGTYGNVRYRISAKIDRPWRFNHNTEKLFNVVGSSTFDLNTLSSAQTPSRCEDEKTVCCLCCAAPVKMSGQTDKTGYVAGEKIWVTGFVDNQTSRKITELKLSLKQHVKYTAKHWGKGYSMKRNKTTTLVEVTTSDSSTSLEKTALLVPSCPPTTNGDCEIIKIDYFVHFEANVSGTPLDANVKLPITIGTVPLKGAYSAGVVSQQPSAPQDPSADLPPPSYELAMGGPQEIKPKGGHEYTFGKLMYAPVYPYYNFDDPAYPPPS